MVRAAHPGPGAAGDEPAAVAHARGMPGNHPGHQAHPDRRALGLLRVHGNRVPAGIPVLGPPDADVHRPAYPQEVRFRTNRIINCNWISMKCPCE